MSTEDLRTNDPRPAGPTKTNDVRGRSVAVRTLTAVIGGYALVYFTADALALGLAAAGATSRADAVLIGTNLAFLLAPAVVIWAFSVRRLWVAAAPPFVMALVLALVSGFLRP